LRLFLYGGKAKESGESTDSQNLHKEISTHHLTVLTTSAIVSIEHENSVFYEKQVTGNDFMMITEDTMSRRWAYEYQ
jgi:hypothetical protein